MNYWLRSVTSAAVLSVRGCAPAGGDLMSRARNGSTRRYRRSRALVLAHADLCWLCGKPFTDPRDPPVCDHVIPVSRGGTDHPSNLRAAHRSCNLRRGNKPVNIPEVRAFYG
jgi:5-methylcytosine-specific restriction endonuclease McrA